MHQANLITIPKTRTSSSLTQYLHKYSTSSIFAHLAFYQLTDNFIVKIFNFRPSNPFCNVFFLLKQKMNFSVMTNATSCIEQCTELMRTNVSAKPGIAKATGSSPVKDCFWVRKPRR